MPPHTIRSLDSGYTSDLQEPYNSTKWFYELLLALFVLQKEVGMHPTATQGCPATKDNRQSPSLKALRRDYTRHLAYLCNYDEGGDRVTAIVLEGSSAGATTYWFASNKTPQPHTDRMGIFLKDTLENLQKMSSETCRQTTSKLFTASVKYSEKKILRYRRLLKVELTYFLNPETELSLDQGDKENLVKWFQEFNAQINSPETLCKLAYFRSGSPNYDFVSQKANESGPHAKHYEAVSHLTGRLHHTMKAVVCLVDARLQLPYLFVFDNEPKVERVYSPPAGQFPLVIENIHFRQIADSLIGKVNDPILESKCRNGLDVLEREFNLSGKFQERVTSPWNPRPRVHAELILLNHIRTRDFEFMDNDRYIGCSKPACYCCNSYMNAHPDRCELYGSHGNGFPAWRTSVIVDCLFEIQTENDVMEQMIKQLEDDVLLYLLDPRPEEPRAPRRADSWTEISTSKESTSRIFQEIRGFLEAECGSDCDIEGVRDGSPEADSGYGGDTDVES